MQGTLLAHFHSVSLHILPGEHTQAEVEALIKCHEEKPYGKFFNACGTIAEDLNVCFREEKKLRKAMNTPAGRRALSDAAKAGEAGSARTGSSQ